MFDLKRLLYRISFIRWLDIVRDKVVEKEWPANDIEQQSQLLDKLEKLRYSIKCIFFENIGVNVFMFQHTQIIVKIPIMYLYMDFMYLRSICKLCIQTQMKIRKLQILISQRISINTHVYNTQRCGKIAQARTWTTKILRCLANKPTNWCRHLLNMLYAWHW